MNRSPLLFRLALAWRVLRGRIVAAEWTRDEWEDLTILTFRGEIEGKNIR